MNGEEHNCQVLNFGADFGSSIIRGDLRFEQSGLQGQVQPQLQPRSIDGQSEQALMSVTTMT